ncbi:ubiquitin carboxyl-terminal hydrolase calypso [Frankliniella occidentalis]|uniref:Ubiquitin carboxyl-terminal hydrolase n=1 Tax=Frankliniella occidentalis TaxID=133901 RepID=A0A6J1SZZ8_FRAOC|nr:ubiquitin carboxyl-terminal hydrolase calypso [Frankliniella occidentalis]
MPVDINRLTDGWLELESDPGLFTLLLEDFGVKGVQVEEIYDLQKSLEGPVYGFIFLFRWIEERRSRRKIIDQSETFVKDDDVVNSIFFAQQMVPNSCATHALISVLLNCPNIHLGGTLTRLKQHTLGMCPENKGWAIGNTPELASAHNSHAMPQAKRRRDKSIGVPTGRSTGDAFHFVSYVPINGKLFELDGLKPFPMDHGPWSDSEDWTEKFRKVITDRLGMSTGEQYHDIRFNLMAVVPDRRLALTHKLKMLNTNRQIVSEALQQVTKIKKKGLKDKENKSLVKDKLSVKIKEEESNDSTSGAEVTDSDILNNVKVGVGGGDGAIIKEESCKMEVDEEKCKPPRDYTTPLTIQTSLSPSVSTSCTSSTDTSSEVGSAFNSPTTGWGWNSGQNSPSASLSPSGKGLVSQRLSSLSVPGPKLLPSPGTSKPVSDEAGQEPPATQLCGTTVPYTPQQFQAPHAFAPQDLLALLKNLEAEISVCQASLRDENEKRKKYKIDDSRRIHNYDEFICTFLSMLAEQGKLASLVQQHQLHSSKKVMPSRVMKKSEPKTQTITKKKRGRGKKRR